MTHPTLDAITARLDELETIARNTASCDGDFWTDLTAYGPALTDTHAADGEAIYHWACDALASRRIYVDLEREAAS